MNSSNAKKARNEQVKILQEVKRTILFRSLEVMEAAVGNTATASDQPAFLRLQASFATASQTPHSFLCAMKKRRTKKMLGGSGSCDARRRWAGRISGVRRWLEKCRLLWYRYIYEQDPSLLECVSSNEGALAKGRQWLSLWYIGRILESITVEAEDGVSATDSRRSAVYRVKWNWTAWSGYSCRLSCARREDYTRWSR